MYPVSRHWDANESWYKVSTSTTQWPEVEWVRCQWLSSYVSKQAVRRKKNSLHLDYLLYYCTLIVSDFCHILLLSVSACFSVQYWHPKFKPVKSGFLPAHKPGFTGLKTSRLPGFSGTQVAFPRSDSVTGWPRECTVMCRQCKNEKKQSDL